MAITVEKIETSGPNIDLSSQIAWESLDVNQQLTNLVDSASFTIRKYGSRSYTPTVNDEIVIKDGTTSVFGGNIQNFSEGVESGGGGVTYKIKCVDYTYLADSILVSETYENMTIADIIDDAFTNFTDGTFDSTTYVTSTFLIEKIVFNQVPISTVLKRLAKIVGYDWYIGAVKDVHFFSKYTNTAPYDLEDDSGNYIYESLSRKVDGSQLANKVKVRGGEYDAATFTDTITVSGSNTKSFQLPYKFSNLTVKLNTVSQTVGIDNVDSFTGVDVLYNYNERMIRWETALTDLDQIEFSGNPKTPVLAIARDSASVAQFGTKEKIIRDTSIEDLDTARRRAVGELQTYKDGVENASFNTYTAGLRTGMVINLTSTVRNVDTDFLIKSIKFNVIDPNTFNYKISLVTTRQFELVSLLQSLLEPDALQADEAETNEVIEIDAVDVTITELIEAVSAVEDLATVSIAENIQKDPLGAGVEPEWVLADYFPTSPTDPKRNGLLDVSLEVY